MNDQIEELAEHRRSIEGLIPYLDAIRSIAEIAWRRAEQQAAPLAAYRTQIELTFERVLATLHPDEQAWLRAQERSPADHVPVGLLLITSERGLCGAFSDRVVDYALEQERAFAARGQPTVFLCLGARGQRRLAAAGRPIRYGQALPSLAVPTYVEIERIALDLLGLEEERAFSRLLVIHNAPMHRFQYAPAAASLLPPEIKPFAEPSKRRLVEPAADVTAFITQCLTEHVLLGLYHAVLQSAVSEQLARVYTMRLATENARKLLDQLGQDYASAVKQDITNSLLETVSGYESARSR